MYGLIIAMLIAGTSLLAVPFIYHRTVLSISFAITLLFFIVFSSSTYIFTNDHVAFQHYQLQKEVQQLGGVTAIIERIKQKLARNPQDAQGWFILGKLYLANHDELAAHDAFGKAWSLEPGNRQFDNAYHKTK